VIRIHADENVSSRIIEGLRRRGILMTAAAERGLLGAVDPEHFSAAMALGAILLTADPDHLALAREAAVAGHEHPSVIYFHIAWSDPAEVVRETCRIAVSVPGSEARGRIWFVPWTRRPKK
jgi:predicted nuclease of predicted toxin-antitoxin system